MERLRETVLRPPLGDRFSVPKNSATLTEFQGPTPSFMGGGSVGGPGSMSSFMPFMMGGPFFGGPPFMSYSFPWMPAGFGVPGVGLGNLAGSGPPIIGGGGGGGGETGSTDPYSNNYTLLWPQNNVFLAEIRGWERAVAPPDQSGNPDPLRWIWKYKWREVGTNNLWPSHATRAWDANPGVAEVHAYNGCEYANWAEKLSENQPNGNRRVFFGPFGNNLEKPSTGYVPHPNFDVTAVVQAWKDWTLFTDYLGGQGTGEPEDTSLKMWDGNQNPAVTVGQPLPIGHHGKAWLGGTLFGDPSQDHLGWSMDDGSIPNVHVLMMERWQKVSGLNSLSGGPEWCPDCLEGGNSENYVTFGEDNYVCSYWFYATNARVDMPWVPAAADVGSGWVVKAPLGTGTEREIPNYVWGADNT